MLSPGGSLLAGGMTPALLGRHLPDDQSALLDLLPNGIELLVTFLLLTFPMCSRTHLHQGTSPRFGLLAQEMARDVGAAGAVDGIDPSETMLALLAGDVRPLAGATEYRRRVGEWRVRFE